MHTHSSSMSPWFYFWIKAVRPLRVLRRPIVLLPFLFFFLQLTAQSPLIDSLVNELKTETLSDAVRVDLLNDLADAHTDYDSGEIPQYARAALTLAEKIDYVEGQATALDLLGYYYYDQRDLQQAEEYYDRALELAEKSGEQEVVFNVLGSKGIMLLEKARYAEALDYFQQAIDLGKELGLDDVAHHLSTVGWTHGNIGNAELSERYIQESIEWAAQAKSPEVQIHGRQQSGYLAWKKKEYDQAIADYNQALEIADLHGLPWSQERIHYSLSTVYRDLGQYAKSRENVEKAIAISEKMGNSITLSRNLLGLGELLVEKGDYEEAVEVGRRSLAISDTLNIPDLSVRNLQVLQKAYERQGDYENAFYYQNAAHTLSDSLQNDETTKALAEQESTYQLEKKTIENELLLARQEEQSAMISRQRTLAITGGVVLALLALLGFLLYKSYRNKTESNRLLEAEVERRTQALTAANEALVRSNESLERFAYATSHDMKEPMRNICSFAGLLRYELRPEKDSKTNQYLEFLITGTKQLESLVDDILDFSKLSKNEGRKTMPVDLNQIMGEIKYALSVDIERQDVVLQWSEQLPTVEGRHAKFLALFQNLIENGIKFNDSSPPIITVGYHSTEREEVISVADNGIGIELPYRNKIFGMFARLHPRGVYEGSGLGLPLCKTILDELGGRMEVKSEAGKGSTFIVYLPKTSMVLERSRQLVGYD